MSCVIYQRDPERPHIINACDLRDRYDLQGFFINEVHQDDSGYWTYDPTEYIRVNEPGFCPTIEHCSSYWVARDCAEYISGEYRTALSDFYAWLMFEGGVSPSECVKLSDEATDTLNVALSCVDARTAAEAVASHEDLSYSDFGSLIRFESAIRGALDEGVSLSRILDFASSDEMESIADAIESGVPPRDAFA